MSKVREIVVVGLSSAVLVALQVALSPIPNVEVITLLFIVYRLVFTLRVSFLISVVFSTLQALTWGFGDWVIGYYWVWGLWTVIISVLKPFAKKNSYKWSLIAAVWGAMYGGLFAINHGFFYGFEFSLAYWIRGFGFDLVHSLSNYLVVAALLSPILNAFEKLGFGDLLERR